MRTTLLLVVTLAWSGPAAAQTVVRYEPKEADLKYVFGVAAPVATVKPGDIIDTRTFDCFGNAIQKPGDTLAKVKGDNPLTGPFYVEGAEPGRHARREDPGADRRQQPGRRRARAGIRRAQHDQLHADAPRAGAGEDLVLPDRSREERGDVHRARLDVLDADPAASVPRVPGRRARRSSRAARSRRRSTAATWTRRRPAPATPPYFPVNVRGALLYLGDGHAAMGDGEIAGTAIEVPMRARLQVDVIKGQKIGWPRFENATSSWRSAPTARWTTRCGSRSRS